MKILIIGNGAREHSLGYKIKQNSEVKKIFFAKGNGGTSKIGENVNIEVTDIKNLLKFAKEKKIDITIVGPEVPLGLGIVDEFKKENLLIIGPDKKSAMLETSKSFAKNFMEKYEIPTAKFKTFTSSKSAVEFLNEVSFPIVIKVDGLAEGKGVLICENFDDAKNSCEKILDNKNFGDAGSKIVIEEFLTGREVSLLCFVDNKNIVPMESASDYKKAFDDDRGLNTGGMGSISPSPNFDISICNDILEKTFLGLNKENFDYKGIIFIGLMITDKGPMVLEYNVRFGDPETESLMMRLETDLLTIFENILSNNLSKTKIVWKNNFAISVVVASSGYPEKYEIGNPISKLPTETDNFKIFHAGTVIENNILKSNGGRVLVFSASAKSYDDARKVVYENIKKIEFKNSFYRSDIGYFGGNQ